MDQQDNLDLLDLEQDNEVDSLPEATPFSSPRPRKPWLLMGLGVAIIVLATWIIVAGIGRGTQTSVDVDLDAPVVTETKPVEDLNVPAKPVVVEEKPVEAAKPVAKPEAKPAEVKPVETDGTPVRVVADRKEVTFNPDKPAAAAKPVVKSAPKPAAQKQQAATSGSIYVQFGSYGTREAAQSAERKMRSSHASLFNGKQFVILAAQVNGKTTYRLRVAFHNTNEANGFCRNAKSDGLDCYVTK